MTHYEQSFETGWDSLSESEAVDRAYALGVAAALGEYHTDELEAVRNEMDTSYSKSVIDLAFKEGKNEGREIDVDDGGKKVWSELVEDEKITVDRDEVPAERQTGLPSAVERIKALERPDRDSTDVVDLPEFLE
jgi:hypothetical protein